MCEAKNDQKQKEGNLTGKVRNGKGGRGEGGSRKRNTYSTLNGKM
jgi:hypothetical protein